MDIAVVAPSPVPLAIGGAENLWWGLVEHLNRRTDHHADLIKLPTPERDFWEIVDSYRRWAALDVTGYEAVISGKYPAWMVAHPRHFCFLLHPLRGVYDTYPAGLPDRCHSGDAEVQGLVALLDAEAPDRSALDECFARLDSLRRRTDLPPELFALPGPLIRQVVHFLDRIGRGGGALAQSVTMSETVARRPGYFPAGKTVPVAHPPTNMRGLRRAWGPGRYLFTVSRLDAPKRIDLLVAAMAHVEAGIQLRIAGTGPHEPALRQLAANDRRIRFDGFLNETQLAAAYAGARAVLFAPFQEDYGFITLEAMLSGRAVLTTTDSGGPTELVQPGVSGLITEPNPAALGWAMNLLARRPQVAWRLGQAGYRRAQSISWDRVLQTLLGD